MHWLEKWRTERGLNRFELAKMVAPCSEQIIFILENQHGGMTHPGIAARIADLTGATPEQFDGMVPERYRGTYTPGKAKSRTESKGMMTDGLKSLSENHIGATHVRAVLKIGLDCQILARYSSIVGAAADVGRDVQFINNRCFKRLQGNEFEPLGFTFRHEDEWNGPARALLMPVAMECKKQRENGIVRFGQTIYLHIDGKQHSVPEWSEIVGVSKYTILQRLSRGMSAKDAVFTPVKNTAPKSRRKAQ